MTFTFKIIIIFIILIASEVISNDIVFIPFSSHFNHKTKKEISSFDDFAKNNLYSKILIGDPPNEIQAFISVQHSYFSITSSQNVKNTNDFYSHYNITKSYSFKNISTGRYLKDNSIYDSMAMEKFKLNKYNYINNESYNITIDDMVFIYNNKDSNIKNNNQEKKANSYYLNIGFQIINQKYLKEREKYNFIYQLKKRNIINKYDWTIMFQKGPKNNGNFLDNPDYLINARGQIYIGGLPYNYNNEQIKTTYSIYTPQLFKWGLQFSDIYYYKNNNNNNNKTDAEHISITDAQININNYIILAPMIYFHKIKSEFFDYYLQDGTCKIYQGNEYKTFYCEKSEKFGIKNLKKFPTLYLRHYEFNYTFEFTYEDLFLEKEHNFWFLISLSSFQNDLEEWNIGIIFLRKYNLIFNQDKKTLSFYNKDIHISNSDETLYNKRIVFCVVLIIIIIGFIIFIGSIYKCIRKKLFKSNKDKKRLNHINDNSEYLKEDKIDINKKSYYHQLLLVEMKGLMLS